MDNNLDQIKAAARAESIGFRAHLQAGVGIKAAKVAALDARRLQLETTHTNAFLKKASAIMTCFKEKLPALQSPYPAPASA